MCFGFSSLLLSTRCKSKILHRLRAHHLTPQLNDCSFSKVVIFDMICALLEIYQTLFCDRYLPGGWPQTLANAFPASVLRASSAFGRAAEAQTNGYANSVVSTLKSGLIITCINSVNCVNCSTSGYHPANSNLFYFITFCLTTCVSNLKHLMMSTITSFSRGSKEFKVAFSWCWHF